MITVNQGDILRLCTEKLSELFGTEVIVTQSRNVGGGCINQAIRMGTNVGEFFLKWNASAPTDMFIREAFALNEMRSAKKDHMTKLWGTI